MAMTYRADQIRLNAVDLMQSASDPSSGAGIAAVVGSLLARSGTAQLWLKTGANDTEWTRLVQSFNWYSVKDYHARGDGVTDDTAAIQAAIDDCQAHGGGVVYFPNGTYCVTQISLMNTSGVQLQGAGPSSVVRWTWDAAGAAGSMITLTGGTSRTKIQMLQLDGSGLLNPDAGGNNHLILVDGDNGGVIETHVWRCVLTGMPAASGDGVHVVGAVGNLASRIWVLDSVFDGCSRFGVGIAEGVEYVWVTLNHMQACGTEIAVVAASDVNINSIIIRGNEIFHTGSSRHALRVEGGATELVTNLIVAQNIVHGGFVTLSNAQYVIENGNVIVSGDYANADAVLRVFGAVRDAIISANLIARTAGADAGMVLALESDAGNAPTIARVGGNVLVQEVNESGFLSLVDVSRVSFGHNTMWASGDAGSSTVPAVDIQAVTAGIAGVQIGPGNNVTAAAGTFAAFARLLANGQAIGDTQIAGNAANAAAYGIWFEAQSGGSFNGMYMCAGNNFPGATMFNRVGATVRPRVGFNGSPTLGANLIQSPGAPSSISAPIGSMYLREDGGHGTAAYYNETGGAAGWVGIGGSPIVFGAGDLGAVDTALYMAPGFIAVADATERPMAMTRTATLKNLYVRVATAGVDAATVTYTVRKNGVDTTLEASLGNTATGTASDTANTVGVVAGDLVSVQVTKSAAVSSGQQNVTATIEVG